MNPIIKAGGIITKTIDNKPHILLIYRSKHKDWTFPKGHKDDTDPDAKYTAIREIKEETNLDTEIIKELPHMEWVNVKNEHVINYMYLMKNLETSEMKIEKDGDELRWVEIDQVNNLLDYNNLIEYFDSIKGEIN